MNQYKHEVPKTGKDKDGNEKQNLVFGSLTIRKPNYLERMEYIDECGFDVTEKGEVQSGMKKFKLMTKMVKLTLPHVEKVELEKPDGSKICSVEEMINDADCDEILADLAGLMINGFRISKN